MTQTEIREMLVLGDAVVVTVADLDKFKGEMQRRIEAEQLLADSKKREADLICSVEGLAGERDQLATELNETHVDENGTAWTRPTAWAYMQVCKARDKHAERVKTLEDALKSLPCTVIHQGYPKGATCLDCRHMVLSGESPATPDWIETNRCNPRRVLCDACFAKQALAAKEPT